MKKHLILISILLIGTVANASVYREWKINSKMKFNVGYLPSSQIYSNAKVEKPLLKPYYDYDIKNINLSDFKKLGFQTPIMQNENEYNFFIKIYKCPNTISEKDIYKKFSDEFSIEFGNDFNELNNFISKKENINTKFCQIEKKETIHNKKSPASSFLTTNNKDFNENFLNNIIFYSIYLEPTRNEKLSLAEKMNDNTLAIKDFQNELISYYKRNFCEVQGEDKNYLYFWGAKTKNKTTYIIKIPKSFYTFKNWQKLSMPQNPNKIFLSNLLLIYSTEYKQNTDQAPKVLPSINSEEFKLLFSEGKTTVLEVASVIEK